MVVSGGAVSTFHVREAGLPSWLPAASSRAPGTCASPRRAARRWIAAPCRRRRPRRRACTGTSRRARWRVNAKRRRRALRAAGGGTGRDRRVRVGRVDGEAAGRRRGPPLPAASIARDVERVRRPRRAARSCAARRSAANAPASTRHWNVAPARCENVNVGVVSWSRRSGRRVIVVAGAAVSTDKVGVAGSPGVAGAVEARAREGVRAVGERAGVNGQVQWRSRRRCGSGTSAAVRRRERERRRGSTSGRSGRR